ncbi:MAG: sulfite exporter TauE/SafE family protein [Gemmobacter sp.]
MEYIQGGLPAVAFWAACGIALFAGFVKGVVGFAMPLIMISAFGSFMPPETALAGLVVATLTTNLHQALRWGGRAAWETVATYRRMILALVAGIFVSAPFVAIMPQALLFALMGVPIVAYAAVQLAGRSLALPIGNRRRAEYGLGAIGGLYGGLSGVWGPPVLVYLLSVRAGKAEAVRVQGVVFLIGMIAFAGAHLASGVLNATTLPFSAALAIPAALGMIAGFRVQDRLDAERFRWWTLALLLLTGLNLVRRAVLG